MQGWEAAHTAQSIGRAIHHIRKIIYYLPISICQYDKLTYERHKLTLKGICLSKIEPLCERLVVRLPLLKDADSQREGVPVRREYDLILEGSLMSSRAQLRFTMRCPRFWETVRFAHRICTRMFYDSKTCRKPA